MSAVLKGLFRWSLQITGVSIIWYNYQPYEKQQKLIGIYNFAKNSYRFSRALLSLSQDFKQYRQGKMDPPALASFRQNTARKLEQLCEQNRGVYARIAEIVAKQRDVVPEDVRSELGQLNNKTREPLAYSDVKDAIASIFSKDMKDLFDGFQTKPLKVGLFTQTHKAVLLENYREAVVKVLLPSLKVQAEHDIWFINKAKDYIVSYLQKHSVRKEDFQLYLDVLKEAEREVAGELDLEQQVQTADRHRALMYDSNSEMYVPYYYNKLCNKYVVIRQFVEGVAISDVKGLRELGLLPEVAFAHVLSEIHRQMKKLRTISGQLAPDNILLRRYIRPYKSQREEVSQEEQRPKGKPAAVPQILPKYQVVLLAQNNFHELQAETVDNLTAFWGNLKKEKKRVLPSVATFYDRIPKYKSLREDVQQVMRHKYYLYEPLIRIYEQITKKPV